MSSRERDRAERLTRRSVNEALDALDTAADALADYFAGDRIDLIDRLAGPANELEELKADIWEALDA